MDSAYLVKIGNTNLDLFKRLVLKHGYQNVTNRIQTVAEEEGLYSQLVSGR